MNENEVVTLCSPGLDLSAFRGDVVVLIDDEPGDIEILSGDLRALGVEPVVISDLDSAREWLRYSGGFREVRLRLVVLDLMFPSHPRDGLQFLEQLRRGGLGVDPETPVVMFSGVGQQEVIAQAESLGIAGFIKKGQDPRILLEHIAVVLGRKEASVAEILCEVIDCDYENGLINVRMGVGDAWVMEAPIELSACPKVALVPGGAFYIDVSRVYGSYGWTYVTRFRGVRPEEEEEELRRLLKKE
jgi:DNA-binding NarL/FixJ family response regulator